MPPLSRWPKLFALCTYYRTIVIRNDDGARSYNSIEVAILDDRNLHNVGSGLLSFSRVFQLYFGFKKLYVIKIYATTVNLLLLFCKTNRVTD